MQIGDIVRARPEDAIGNSHGRVCCTQLGCADHAFARDDLYEKGSHGVSIALGKRANRDLPPQNCFRKLARTARPPPVFHRAS